MPLVTEDIRSHSQIRINSYIGMNASGASMNKARVAEAARGTFQVNNAVQSTLSALCAVERVDRVLSQARYGFVWYLKQTGALRSTESE